MNLLRRLLLTCLIAVLGGCATTVVVPSPPLTQRHYQPLIEMKGRLSAQYEANYRDQSVSTRFTWTQSPDQILISLESPTGQTVSTIEITAGQAILRQGDHPPRYASDVNALTTEVLGWPLPIAGLRDWLQGFLNDTHQQPVSQAEADQTFRVDGWLLRYVSWTTEGSSERPKRLDLSRQTAEAGQVSLRIVVDDWATP